MAVEAKGAVTARNTTMAAATVAKRRSGGR
jgi:hypothetical protein